METKVLFLTYTNSDLTEGRGYHITIAVSETLSTAERLGKGKYVQGGDCPVDEVECINIDNQWYIPLYCVTVIEPTENDLEMENHKIAIEKKQATLRKLKALGISEEDLRALLT